MELTSLIDGVGFLPLAMDGVQFCNRIGCTHHIWWDQESVGTLGARRGSQAGFLFVIAAVGLIVWMSKMHEKPEGLPRSTGSAVVPVI